MDCSESAQEAASRTHLRALKVQVKCYPCLSAVLLLTNLRWGWRQGLSR